LAKRSILAKLITDSLLRILILNDSLSVWTRLHHQATELAKAEPMLADHYFKNIIDHNDFASALACHLAAQLGNETVPAQALNSLFLSILTQHSGIVDAALHDMEAYYQRDPACDNYCRPFLFFKGFLAIQSQRLAHALWHQNRRSMARYIQHKVSLLCCCDIHPAARLGHGLMVDHATGLVIGETAEVGNNVSLLHGVTLGGSGNDAGKRHPTIKDGVMISAGAKVLGNITVGNGSKVGAGSVVLTSVPAHVTVAGVPAKIVGQPSDQAPSLSMDQDIGS
tara:strand:+ start:1885 stop:2727 length:843 start_codon:yes stop_codon:yes gene_type:complete